ncbi:MAG: GNAT family N-acetyltransferase [Alphaproteobacteria bacterium]|nr:GNAT family N-acetyltransferase [Alphaproteobacteria bacterium]
MRRSEIETVRSFNRTVTRRAGALEADYLKRGRPLGEARLLFEIGPAGAEARALRARLGLDSGYFSRLVAKLARQRLLRTAADPADARRRRLTLTARGLREYAGYDRSSDDLARACLAPLDASRRARLLAAMAEVDRLLGDVAVEFRAEDPNSRTARACVSAYFAELARRFEGGFDPGKPGYANPKDAGRFYVAWLDGAAVGCGALKPVGPGTSEIKRMWVAPEARGRGIARRLLAFLEEEAARSGVRRVVLDTNKALVEAHALYRAAGYRATTRFNDNPYAHLWFEKSLKPKARRR